jgi:SpoVK/Ycf46/Vps4 family AAA+-type ATPase
MTSSRRPVSSWSMRCKPSVGLDQIVLPSTVKMVLRQIVMDMGHQLAQSKFTDNDPGFSVIFTGPSGAKTTAAEAMAYDLGVELMRINLSAVLEKYIGDTQENLTRVFDDAERTQAVLFFDEADALFGKRTDVKDAHNRYANSAIAYILERIRSYPGLALLVVNTNRSFDPPSLDRPCFLVEFGPTCL